MSNLWDNLLKIRAQAPLIHNITNYVVMNTTANALLAVGASPVMAHAIDEVEVMVGYAKALVLNIGTLSPLWVEAMVRAGRVARARSIPTVLDPVGAGATPLRTEVALELLRETAPTVVRGNASEIRALAESGGFTKGVDSTDDVDSALEAARSLFARYGSVVSISGPTDVIVSGEAPARVHNGHPMMTRVTGMGCAATALTGALLAVESSSAQAATQAMLLMGIAGEMAAAHSSGPGSLQLNFLDALYAIQQSDIDQRAKWESGSIESMY
jgi:hydroxyethylthiazole kinase